MRTILISTSVAVLALLIAWLAAGSRITLLLDRFGTVQEAVLPLDHYSLNENGFQVGPRGWFLAKELALAADSRNRLTVSKDGRGFTMGPISKCYGGPAPHYEFMPDTGDQVSFVKSRSRIAWPTPFEWSLFSVPMTSWRRHSYFTLLWKKSSGAAMELVWRDRQGFYAHSGWIDENLFLPPEIKITASPFEAAVVRYLTGQKGWKRDEFRLEDRGPTTDGTYDVTAAIHSNDAHAVQPGAGRSVEVFIDKISGQVAREAGGQ